MMLLIISILFIVLFVFCFYKKINLSEQFQTTPVTNYMQLEGTDITHIFININQSNLYVFLYEYEGNANLINSIKINKKIEYDWKISTLKLRNAKNINSKLSFNFSI